MLNGRSQKYISTENFHHFPMIVRYVPSERSFESTKEPNSDLLLYVPAILGTQRNTDVSTPISGISA